MPDVETLRDDGLRAEAPPVGAPPAETPPVEAAPVEATPRNLHYGEFYGLRPLPDGGRPLLVVHGNCQAESLRVVLEGRFGGADGPVSTVRLVPAHELTPDDVPHLRRILAHATYLVTQPIVDGYRGIPVGTRDLLAVAPHLRVAVVPVLRWAGLHPTQAIVRSADGEPPVVPYHDLRTVLEAATGRRPDLTERAAAALRQRSRDELARRIEAHGAVDVTHLFTTPGERTVHVINHPTNAVLDGVVTALAERLGLGEGRAFDPGRILLGSIVAPLEAVPAALNGLEPDSEDAWRVQGAPVPSDDIRRAHLAWYADHPAALDAALTRHRDALAVLGGTA